MLPSSVKVRRCKTSQRQVNARDSYIFEKCEHSSTVIPSMPRVQFQLISFQFECHVERIVVTVVGLSSERNLRRQASIHTHGLCWFSTYSQCTRARTRWPMFGIVMFVASRNALIGWPWSMLDIARIPEGDEYCNVDSAQYEIRC